MNERIDKLIEQATINIGDEFHPIDFFHKEKFAELIVRECMKMNHEHFSDEDPYSIDSLYRQHFGFQ